MDAFEVIRDIFYRFELKAENRRQVIGMAVIHFNSINFAKYDI